MKYLKVIFINLCLLIITLILVEAYVASKWGISSNNLNHYKNIVLNTINADEYFTKLYKKEYVEGAFTSHFRPDENINSIKKPIILMGCSFTWGFNLNEDETISHKLAKLTNRPVYNRAGNGWGLSQFVYQLKRSDFYNLHREPEYIIYIFIKDHLHRLDKFKIEPSYIDYQPRYKLKDKKLYEIKPKIYDGIMTISNFNYRNSPNKKYTFDDAIIYFIEGNNELKKHWKNTKLIIADYPINAGNPDYVSKEQMDELTKNGITYVKIGHLVNVDLTDEKYKSDESHPSSEAWDIILPKLINKLNL